MKRNRGTQPFFAVLFGVLSLIAALVLIATFVWLIVTQNPPPARSIIAVATLAFLFCGFSGCALVPAWRAGVGKAVERLSMKLPWGWRVQAGLDHAAQATAELPIEKEPPIPHDKEARGRLQVFLSSIDPTEQVQELAGEQEHDTLFEAARTARRRRDYHLARIIIDAALNVFVDDPKFLILSGYLSSQLGEKREAISEYEKAAEVAYPGGPYREQHFLALANVSYALASIGDPRDRERALQAGKAAADHVDEFENRDSFAINYGYALYRYARTAAEYIRAFRYLSRLEDRSLSAEEVEEVRDYMRELMNRMQEAVAAQTNAE